MESWESFLYTILAVLGLGCRGLAATLALPYRKLWKATSRHWDGLFRHHVSNSRPLSSFFPPSLLRPLHFSFHVNFSTPFTPPHSDIPPLNAEGVAFFFFFFCSSKTPHIYLYSKLQLYTVLTLFSVVILTAATHNYLCLHPSDLQFSTLI